MEIDFTNGVSLEIGGELGKFNTIPLENLVQIFSSLQELVNTIAVSDINQSSVIDLNNFKLELFGFKEGSAIPQFKFTNRIQTTLTNDVEEQREIISKHFNELVKITYKGDYQQIKKSYPNSLIRNKIVESLYSFTNSFGNSPVSFVDYKDQSDFTPLIDLRKLPIEVKKSLITEIIENEIIKSEEYGYGKFKLVKRNGKKKKKTIEVYSDKNIILSYAPNTIEYKNKTYILKFPLMCSIEKEEGYFVIKSPMLDIIGTGETEEEAKQDFNQDFDFAYNRYNELSDEALSDRIVDIKNMFNILVKEVL